MENIQTYLLLIIQVVAIDVILSGDNAVVIGMVANGLREDLKNKAIFFGMAFALLLRVIFTGLSLRLFEFKIIGLIGGLLLIYISAKLLWDTIANGKEEGEYKAKKTFITALVAIGFADLSMSLDNILAIAAVTVGHPWIMALGLTLSIAIMAVGAKIVSVLMEKWKWLNYVGIALIFYVAVKMIIINYDVIPIDKIS
jgi:YjbE family integral membrane protein